MKLQPGTTYKVTHEYSPNMQVFATCLGEKTHMSCYTNHVQYYRNTKDLERTFENNGFKVEAILD